MPSIRPNLQTHGLAKVRSKDMAKIAILAGAIVMAAFGLSAPRASESLPEAPASAPVYGYEVQAVFPHDPGAFTQGLIVKDDVFYEGTGLYGRSSLRKVDITSGDVRLRRDLPSAYFGEGITALRDTIYQITWTNYVGFSYVERDTFELIESFPFAFEGWGLTHDGTHLIASDGSSTIRFMDPRTREVVSSIQVRDGSTPVSRLNELEYAEGRIYSNVWFSDRIAVIDPVDGQVEAWLDLSGLRDSVAHYPGADVLNGIAFDPVDRRLFVTGKFWPKVFQINVPALPPSEAEGDPAPVPGPFLLRTLPNPNRGSARLAFALPREGPVSLGLYDSGGRRLRTLMDETRTAGEHILELDLRGVPSGSYYLRLTAAKRTDSERILVLR